MRRMFSIVAVCYSILAVLFCWFVLSSGKADWLRVESPSVAYCGQSFPLNVNLLKPESGFFLSADLHWMDSSGASHGFLASSGPVRIIEGRSVYNMSIQVTPVKEAASVFGVIFISRNGLWKTQIKAASLYPVPVSRKDNFASVQMINQKTVRVIPDHVIVLNPESVILRFVVSGIWFLTALFALAGRQYLRSELIAAASFLSSAWEALNGSIVCGDLLRNISSYAGIYNSRLLPQQLITMAVVLIIPVLVYRYILHGRNDVTAVFWLCLIVFWGTSFLSVISLHESDIIFSKIAAGFEAGQLIRFAASLAGCASIIVSVVVCRYRDSNIL